MSANMVLLQLDMAGFRVLSALLSVLWQSSILLLAAGVLSYALRNRSAAARHAVWTAAVLAIPLLPLLSLHSERWSPATEIAVIPAYAPPQTGNAPAPGKSVPAVNAPAGTPVAAPPPPAPVSGPQHYPWAVGLAGYLAMAGTLLLWTLAGRFRIRRWILEGVPVLDERTLAIFAKSGERLRLSGEILLMEHPGVPAPLVCRVFRPVVVLPSGFADGLSESELRAIALHELSHIKRRDTLVFALAAFVRAVFFFQPLVWIAARRISWLAEVACDSAALEYEGDPAAYAGLLTRVAAGLPARSLSTEMAAGILFSRSAFFRRVGDILSGRPGTIRQLSRGSLVGISGTGLCSLLLASALPLGEKAREITHLTPVRFSAEFPSRLTPGAASSSMHILLDGIQRSMTATSDSLGASTVSADSAGPGEFDYKKGIDLARRGDSLLRTAKGKMLMGTGKDTRIVFFTYDHVSERMLVTVEYPDTDSPFRVRFLYDGEKTTTISFNRSRSGDVTAVAFISPQNKSEESLYNPFLFEYFFYGQDIAEILSTRTVLHCFKTPVSGLAYSRSTKMGDLDVDVFTIVSGETEIFSLYLARQYQYRPVKMAMHDLDGHEIYVEACEYKALDNGIYFPDKGYRKIGNAPETLIDFVAEETEINIPLSEDDFNPDIPEGVKIADFRK